MSGKYPKNFQPRTERRWAERSGQIVAAIERTLQRLFNRDGSLIPIPVKAAVDRRRVDRRSRD